MITLWHNVFQNSKLFLRILSRNIGAYSVKTDNSWYRNNDQ